MSPESQDPFYQITMLSNAIPGTQSDFPSEKRIYFSKQKLKRTLRIFQGILIADIVLAVILGHSFWWAYFPGTFILCLFILAYVDLNKKYNNELPQITISDDGIETEKAPFCSWKSISGEDVDYFYGRNDSGEFFIYNNPAEQQKVLIRYLDTERKDLKELLKTYRERNNKKQSAS